MEWYKGWFSFVMGGLAVYFIMNSTFFIPLYPHLIGGSKTVSGDYVEQVIRRSVNLASYGYVKVVDDNYVLMDVDRIKGYAVVRKYVGEFSDCDDFAIIYVAEIKKKYPGVAVGYVEGILRDGGVHAMVIAVDEDGVHYINPYSGNEKEDPFEKVLFIFI